jgi:hypothetical protein
MLTKKITYTDYNGVQRTEEFMFNLSKAELMEKEMATVGGLESILQTIIDSHDQERITESFKQIILRSYGRKSDDGRSFIKVIDGKPLAEEFAQTEAYSELFMELASDANAAAAFVRDIIPHELSEEVQKQNLTALPENNVNQ